MPYSSLLYRSAQLSPGTTFHRRNPTEMISDANNKCFLVIVTKQFFIFLARKHFVLLQGKSSCAHEKKIVGLEKNFVISRRHSQHQKTFLRVTPAGKQAASGLALCLGHPKCLVPRAPLGLAIVPIRDSNPFLALFAGKLKYTACGSFRCSFILL